MTITKAKIIQRKDYCTRDRTKTLTHVTIPFSSNTNCTKYINLQIVNRINFYWLSQIELTLLLHVCSISVPWLHHRYIKTQIAMMLILKLKCTCRVENNMAVARVSAALSSMMRIVKSLIKGTRNCEKHRSMIKNK